jgi:hypothetical protein
MNGNRVVITRDQLNAVKKAMRSLPKDRLSHPYKSELACLRDEFERVLREVLPQYVISSFQSELLSNKRVFFNKQVWYFVTGDTYDVTILMYVRITGGKIKYQLRLGCWGDLVETGRWF